MAEVQNEDSNMDHLPTPPRMAEKHPSPPSVAEQNHTDNRGSPHSIDYETNAHDRMVTPTRDLKTAGSGRSSSPRPKSASPSEHLLKTTAARVCDGQALERRRSSIHIQETTKTNNAKKAAVAGPPSDRLLKTTVARVADVQAWQQTKGVVKHQDDIWWEVRKPLQDASKANAQFKVDSRLLEPTTSHIYSQRKKYPPRATPDKHIVPGSAEKSPIANSSPLRVSSIPAESALLRPTFNSQVKNVKNLPVPPPPPAMELPSHLTGPQNVPSRLFSPTTSTRSARWKSREEIDAEQAAVAAKEAAVVKKIKAPSEHLVTYNTSMRCSARTKAASVQPDRREAGWNRATKKGYIPPVEAVPPLPGHRMGASPPRRRSDGLGNSRSGEFSHSVNSSLDSVEHQQHTHDDAANGVTPAKAWQEEHYADHNNTGDDFHEEGHDDHHAGEDHEGNGYGAPSQSMDVDVDNRANGLNGELAHSGLMDAHHAAEGEEGDFESY
jgi:hypothetical protein